MQYSAPAFVVIRRGSTAVVRRKLFLGGRTPRYDPRSKKGGAGGRRGGAASRTMVAGASPAAGRGARPGAAAGRGVARVDTLPGRSLLLGHGRPSPRPSRSTARPAAFQPSAQMRADQTPVRRYSRRRCQENGKLSSNINGTEAEDVLPQRASRGFSGGLGVGETIGYI
jgi:hypothetical protein